MNLVSACKRSSDREVQCSRPLLSWSMWLLVIYLLGLVKLSELAEEGFCQDQSCSSLNIDDKPDIIYFPNLNFSDDGSINIYDEVGSSYEQFCTCLLPDNSESKLQQFMKECQNGNCIIQKVLEHWLDGKGKQPVTWRTLILNLRECVRLHQLADEVEFILSDHSVSKWLDEPSTCPLLSQNEGNIISLKENIPGIYKNADEYKSIVDLISETKYCIVEELMPQLDASSASKIKEYKITMDEIVEKLQVSSICAGIFGVIKVGKSSFLNSLLGNAFLPSSKQPETAVGVRVVHDISDDYSRGVLFIRRESDNHTESKSGREAIETWLAKHNAEKRQGCEDNYQLTLRAPLTFLKNRGSNIAFEISDTPGINEAGKQFTDFSAKAIGEMVAYIVMLPVNSLNTDADLDLFKILESTYPSIFVNLNRIIVLVNDYDETFKHENSRTISAAGIPNFVSEYLTKPNILGKRIPPENIYPVSALWALRARQWSSNPYGLLEEPQGSTMYRDAINALQYANIEVKSLKAFTVENVLKLSSVLLELSKISEVERRLHSMLNDESEAIIYESVMDSIVLVTQQVAREIEDLKANLQVAKKKDIAVKCSTAFGTFSKFLSKNYGELDSQSLFKRTWTGIKVALSTVMQALKNSLQGRIGSMIGDLSRTAQVEQIGTVQNHILSEKQKVLNSLRQTLKNEFNKMKDFIMKAEAEVLISTLNQFKDDLQAMASSDCEHYANHIQFLKKKLDEITPTCLQLVQNIPYHPAAEFFSNDFVADGPLKSMTVTGYITKFSHNHKKCKRKRFKRKCKKIPIYINAPVYSPQLTGIKDTYYQKVDHILSLFSAETEKRVKARSSEIYPAILKSMNDPTLKVKKEFQDFVDASQKAVKQVERQASVLLSKRKELAALSLKLKAKLKVY